MAHIHLTEQLPGIRGLLAFRPLTAQPLNALAEVLLRTNEGLSMGERELIATFVSALNNREWYRKLGFGMILWPAQLGNRNSSSSNSKPGNTSSPVNFLPAKPSTVSIEPLAR